MTTYKLRQAALSDSITAFNSVMQFENCVAIGGFHGTPSLLTRDSGTNVSLSIPFNSRTVNLPSFSDVQSDFMTCIRNQLPSWYFCKYAPLFSTFDIINITSECVRYHLILRLESSLSDDTTYNSDLRCVFAGMTPIKNAITVNTDIVYHFMAKLRLVNYENINLLTGPGGGAVIQSRDYTRLSVVYNLDEKYIMDTINFKREHQAAWEDIQKQEPIRAFIVENKITMKEPYILTQHLHGEDYERLQVQYNYVAKTTGEKSTIPSTSVIRILPRRCQDQSGRDQSVWGPTGQMMDERREREKEKKEQERKEYEERERARRIARRGNQ